MSQVYSDMTFQSLNLIDSRWYFQLLLWVSGPIFYTIGLSVRSLMIQSAWSVQYRSYWISKPLSLILLVVQVVAWLCLILIGILYHVTLKRVVRKVVSTYDWLWCHVMCLKNCAKEWNVILSSMPKHCVRIILPYLKFPNNLWILTVHPRECESGSIAYPIRTKLSINFAHIGKC